VGSIPTSGIVPHYTSIRGFCPSLEGTTRSGLVPKEGVAFCFVCSDVLLCRWAWLMPKPIWGTSMGRRRGAYAVLLAVIGILSGTGLGLWYGWEIAPVEYTDTDIAYLQQTYRDDVVLMIGEAYALDGDLDTARARLAALSLSDPASSVADLGEVAITENWALFHIQALVRLAVDLGERRDSFAPYLSSLGKAP
jgi:hypothetical protein